MPDPVLYDAVTLRHFAVVSRLDLIRSCHDSHDEPRWTEAVKSEIEASALRGHGECASILSFSWLGEALAPEAEDQKAIQLLRIRLSDAGDSGDEMQAKRHLGEAESIHLAKRYGFYFYTDDNDAHRVAGSYLGGHRVHDSVDLLRFVVANGDIDVAGAAEVANRIRMTDRSLRREYERLLVAGDFA